MVVWKNKERLRARESLSRFLSRSLAGKDTSFKARQRYSRQEEGLVHFSSAQVRKQMPCRQCHGESPPVSNTPCSQAISASLFFV